MDKREVLSRLKRMRAHRYELALEMELNPSTLWRFLSGKSKPRKSTEMAIGVALDRLESKIRNKLTPVSNNAARK